MADVEMIDEEMIGDEIIDGAQMAVVEMSTWEFLRLILRIQPA